MKPYLGQAKTMTMVVLLFLLVCSSIDTLYMHGATCTSLKCISAKKISEMLRQRDNYHLMGWAVGGRSTRPSAVHRRDMKSGHRGGQGLPVAFMLNVKYSENGKVFFYSNYLNTEWLSYMFYLHLNWNHFSSSINNAFVNITMSCIFQQVMF